jgi:hypothetical protein
MVVYATPLAAQPFFPFPYHLFRMHDHEADWHNPHLRDFTSTAGVVLSERAYPADERLPAHAHEEHAYFTLVIDGGFAVESAWRSCEVAASELSAVIEKGRLGQSRYSATSRIPVPIHT